MADLTTVATEIGAAIGGSLVGGLTVWRAIVGSLAQSAERRTSIGEAPAVHPEVLRLRADVDELKQARDAAAMKAEMKRAMKEAALELRAELRHGKGGGGGERSSEG